MLLALGLAAWFQEIFSIEWSFPYCSSQSDGPASAVWGMPLPYIRWSTVSSMEYFWMPSVLVLNILLLFAAVFPFVSWVLRKTETRAPQGNEGVAPPAAVPLVERLLRATLTVFGAVLILLYCSSLWFQIHIGVYKVPVANVAHENYETYSDFRPVHFGFKTLRYQCTPLK